MNVRLSAVWRTVKSGQVYLNGAWRTLAFGRAYVSGAWRDIVTFSTPFSALTISPSPLGTASRSSTTMTSGTATATPTGGLGPFSYSWTILSSGGLTAPAINSPATASTTFTATVTNGEGYSGTLNVRCTATDSLGASQYADLLIAFNALSPIQGGTQ